MSWENIERTEDRKVKDSVDEFMDPFGDIDGEDVEAVETDEAEAGQPEVELNDEVEHDDYDHDGETDEADEEQEQSFDVPAYWTVEEKNTFDNLPEDAKSAFLALDKGREAFTTRKSQELSEQMRKVQAMGGIAEMMQSDPNFRNYISQYGQAPQQEQVQDEQPPEDPIDRIKWEAKQELMQEFAPQLQQMGQAQAQMRHQALVQQTLAQYQRDPQFNDAYAEMHKMVAEKMITEGKQAADQYYTQVDSDPAFFGQEFEKAKARIGSGKPAPTGKKVTAQKPKLQGKGSAAQTSGGSAKRFKNAMRSGNAVDMMNAAWGDID